VTAAEVVTASGEVVHASAAENPELFWAIRGGGGNFGIVTAFEFAAHPTTDVFYGTITFAAAEAAAVIQGWADYLRTAPDELTSTVEFANPFGGPGAPVEIYVAFDGDDPELAARAIDPIRRLGTVIGDDVALQPYADILAEGTPPPPGLVFEIAARSSAGNRCRRYCGSWLRSGRRSGHRLFPCAASAGRYPGLPVTPPLTRTAERS
jgi:hypothetical protein